MSPLTGPRPPASPWMRDLYSGFDAARAGWEFPEGTCAGFLGHPSDPVSDGLESTTDAGEDPNQNKCDNDQDSAVKVLSNTELGSHHTNNCFISRLVSRLQVLVVFALTGTLYCGRTDCM